MAVMASWNLQKAQEVAGLQTLVVDWERMAALGIEVVQMKQKACAVETVTTESERLVEFEMKVLGDSLDISSYVAWCCDPKVQDCLKILATQGDSLQ